MLRIHALPPRPEGRGFTRKRMKTKVALLKVWMVVFALAALCFVLPVLAAIPFVIASVLCAACAGLLHKAAKEANCRQ